LLERIAQGQARAGIVEVLEQLTPRLGAALPRAADDENELPDSVLRA
jgi:uncharacterized membrane protein